MVTHDLRMTQYADRVIQMVDGKINRRVDDRREIYAFANALPASAPARALAEENGR